MDAHWENTFDEIKLIVTHDALLIYPYFDEQFDIHAGASEVYLGTVIIQDGKPIALLIRKLTGP